MDQQQMFDINSSLLRLSPLLYVVAAILIIVAVHHYFSTRSESSCEVIGPLLWVGIAVFLVMLGTP